MVQWKELSTRKFSPQVLRQMLSALTTASTVTEKALGLTKVQLNLMKLLAKVANVNAVELALRAALQECIDYVEGLVTATGAHAIFIPIQRPYTGVSLVDSDFGRVDVSSWFEKNDNISAYTQEVLRLNTPDTLNFVASAYRSRGGNRGYWSEFARSLGDSGDTARPLFPPNYAVTGVAVIVGASLLGPMLGALDLFQMLFRGLGRLDSTYNTRPRVQDLRAHTVLLPVSGKLGVQLTWTPVPRVLQARGVSAEYFQAKKIAVVRSKDPHLRECFHWHEQIDGFPEEALLDKDSDTQVIAVLDNDGFLASHTDEIPLEAGVTYFYALAVQYEVSGLSLMSAFSNVERVVYRNYAMTTRRSEPPDWVATPSAIQLFPLLQEIIGRAQQTVARLLARTTINAGPVQMLNRLIRQIDMLLLDARLAGRDLARLERLVRNLSASDLAGIRSTTITVEGGGIQGWGTELAKRLSDRSDPSRPPYDHGELTAGVILVAGAPRLPQLTAIRKIIEILFGDGDVDPKARAVRVLDGPTVTVQGTPLGGARVVRAATTTPSRKVYFDARLQPTTEAPTVPVKKPAFDDALKPADRDPNC